LVATSSRELREGLTTVTQGTLLVGISAFCLIVFTFFARVLIVRSPTADWNAYSLGLTLASILGAVGTLGLPNAVARSLPHAASYEERRTIVRTSIAATVASAFVLGVALWLAAPAMAKALGIPDLRVGLEFFSIIIGTALVSGLIASIFRGYSDVIPNALYIQALSPGLLLVFLVAALELPSIGLSYTAALAAYALSNSITLGLLVVYTLRRLPRHLPPGPQAVETRGNLLRFTVPLFISGVMLTLAGSGDTLVLGAYHSSEVGVYTASLTLARLVGIGIGSASYIFLPVATGFLRRRNPHAVQLIYGTITKWLLAFSLPLFLLFAMLPQRSLGFVYGSGYSAIILPLELTVAAAFTATILGPAMVTQIAYGRVRLVAINSVVAGVVDVGIGLALVPSQGYIGAAIAWGTSNFLLAALSLAELAVMDGVHPFHKHFGVPLAAASIPLALLLFAARARIPELALPPVALVMAGVFVLAVLLTKSIDDGDRLLLESIESMIGRSVPFVRRLARLAGNR
jgi:O-antigen/teichoic acid export membrane protein